MGDEDIVRSIQKLYDEVGVHFSRTRQKKYGEGKSTNWPVTDIYLSQLKSGQRVLDVGCGNGKLITGLPEGVIYVGTDFSQILLEEARKLYPQHDFRYGNTVEHAHWEGLGKFDAIFCVAVLHHIPSRELQVFVLNEMKKCLLPGGFMYLTVWNLWQEKFLQYHLDGHVEVPYNKKWKRYCVAYDIQTMTDLLIEAGWEVAEMFYADREGKHVDVMTGENLVVVAR